MVRPTLVLAVLGSVLVGLISIRTTEVQPAVFAIATVCVSLGYWQPDLAWLWATIVGLGVIAGYGAAALMGLHVAAPPEPNIAGCLVALIPAFISAYVGAALKWTLKPSRI